MSVSLTSRDILKLFREDINEEDIIFGSHMYYTKLILDRMIELEDMLNDKIEKNEEDK